MILLFVIIPSVWCWENKILVTEKRNGVHWSSALSGVRTWCLIGNEALGDASRGSIVCVLAYSNMG